MRFEVARLVGVALFLSTGAGAAVCPVAVLSQLDAESKPSAAGAATPSSVTPMIRVSLDADARAPLSKPVVGRFIRSSLDRGVALSLLAPLPHRRLRQALDAAPATNTWFADAPALARAPRPASALPTLDDSRPLTGDVAAPLPKRHIRVDLSDASGQIAAPLPARRLRLQLD
jgi:hypothetical protein